jgi:formamidopyrimidine-DNA glycosylase
VPELPEVETTVRGLSAYLDGAHLARVTPRRPDMRFPFPLDLAEALAGAQVTGLGRRAKYGLIHTQARDGRALTLIFHLGMSGRWRIDPDPLGPHDHLLLDTGAHLLALNDPRRFGFVDLVETAALERWPAFAALGPEPLGPQLTVEHLRAAFGGRRQAIKLLLLDQRIVAGLGNIYVCEALFRAGIDPRKPAGRVFRPALARLVPAIRDVLEQAIGEGGSTLRDFARPDGQLGYFANSFAVYGREELPCPSCTGPVRRIVQGGRSTWFCSACQN